MDKILIKDLKVTGIIGIYEQERTTPQEISKRQGCSA